jgi:hypothetical protein
MEEVDLTLVTTHKNAVVALLKSEGFNPVDFVWEIATQDEYDRDYAVTFRNRVSVLVHNGTKYFFRFEKYRSKYSPAHQLRTRIEPWDRLMDRDNHLRDWLFYLRMEVEAMDRANSSDNADGVESGRRGETIQPTNVAAPQPVLLPESRNPRAFVSHGAQDRVFVERFAGDLMGYGVDVWYSEWEIKSGDPIRAKIDEGLEGCELFIIVLSKGTVERPWVQIELDAATTRKASGKLRKIIPIKLDDIDNLPPTISGLRWEDFSKQPYDTALRRVLESIFGVDVRPALGEPPQFPQKVEPSS